MIKTDMSDPAGIRTSHGWGYTFARYSKQDEPGWSKHVAAQALVAEEKGYGLDTRFQYRAAQANRPTPKRLHKGRKRNNGMAKFKSNRGGTFSKRLFA